LIDAPGGNTFLSRHAHTFADTLITPLNDSFVDFDLMGDVNPQTLEVIRPSFYSEMVWSCRKQKAQSSRRPIDWIGNLAKRIGFRMATGLSERVIYRELFPTGLTLLDLTEHQSSVSFTMSHVAARQELRDLFITMRIPELSGLEIGF